MRVPRSLRSPLAAAALSATAVLPAGAQHAIATVAADRARPIVPHAATAANAALRTVATYRFAAPRDLRMPAEVTVADSVGQLVASYRLAGAQTAHPMRVELLDADLVLQSETPSGLLTLRLYGQNDADAVGAVAGRWWLGEQQGELRGRVTR